MTQAPSPDAPRAPGRSFMLAVLALLLATSVVVTPLVPTTGSTREQAVDKVLSEAVGRGDVPGVVAVATDRQGFQYQGAFGIADRTSGRPMTTDAIFWIASMTKAVTSVAAMQLVEQGRLSLDAPAEQYLPELADLKVFESFDVRTGAYVVRSTMKRPTIRHLLTHTSGLGYNFTSPIVRDFKPRTGERYAAGPLLFEPGERWLYGTSTDWVGRVVEAVSGQSLEAYFRDRILGPLGLADTFFNVPPDREPRVAAVHRRQPGGRFEVGPIQQARSVTQFNGGGGLFSTATDYTRFLQMFLGGGALNGARILSPHSVVLMGQNQIGGLGVPASTSALPEASGDFSFIADGRDKWGLGFLITADAQQGKRSAGSLSWGGINNTYFWVDRMRGVTGVIMMQYRPFADRRALATYDAFERAVYHAR